MELEVKWAPSPGPAGGVGRLAVAPETVSCFSGRGTEPRVSGRRSGSCVAQAAVFILQRTAAAVKGEGPAAPAAPATAPPSPAASLEAPCRLETICSPGTHPQCSRPVLPAGAF